MRNRHSGRCLAIGGGSAAGGEQATEWTCESNHPEQQ
ncbi:RICIN domain-containing protein [Actinoplanes palleronii]